MTDRRFGLEYNGRPIFEYVEANAPSPPALSATDDVFVYVMGPYTAFDASYAYEDADELDSPFFADPLFDPDRHVTEDGRGDYRLALEEFCADLRAALGVRAFVATDVGIPTKRQVDREGLDEPGMTPLDQSVEFAAVSDAVLFVFTAAGLTTGVGSEVGAVLGEFNLRWNDPADERKPRERLRLFVGPSFSSASIGEITPAYGVDCIEFDSRTDLHRKSQQFLVNVERGTRRHGWPVYDPPEG
ncbi:DUF7509 family protein [Natronobiforma cellulositropha]|uniref:DUF7509 family protein n=1 Tax=Natronobiforma cellulositropha TaxID=1679076 RepID=UPI0021D5C001|nr:hypothetical protein [Natronobiforma cellulositropha]